MGWSRLSQRFGCAKVFLVLLTDFDSTLSDHGAVGLVDDAIDQLEIVRVRDDLVVGEDVLLDAGSATVSGQRNTNQPPD